MIKKRKKEVLNFIVIYLPPLHFLGGSIIAIIFVIGIIGIIIIL